MRKRQNSQKQYWKDRKDRKEKAIPIIQVAGMYVVVVVVDL